MKRLFFIVSFLTLVTNAMAQTKGSITGTVLHNDNKVDGATIYLLKARDSSTLKLAASDKLGTYKFADVAPGQYLISVTAVGFQKQYSSAIIVTPEKPGTGVLPIMLSPIDKSLAAVTVTARRPLVEQRIDRTIINVEASITNVGTSALEVLEKSPGVTVDTDGNIRMNGIAGGELFST
jgi:hypothetical protein